MIRAHKKNYLMARGIFCFGSNFWVFWIELSSADIPPIAGVFLG